MSIFRRRPRQVAPSLHDGASCADADQEITWLRGENKQLRDELAEALRLRTLGGPPPPFTPQRASTSAPYTPRWESGPSTRPATAPEEDA